MKRLFCVLVLLLGLLFMPLSLFAAGSSNTGVGPTKIHEGYYVVTFTWVADDTNGTVPNATVNGIFGYVVKVITDPGATAPTDNYDIVLNDKYSADVMGGELIDRDTAVTEQAVPKVGNAYGGSLVNGPLTMQLTNNSVNSATGVVYIFISL